MCADRIKYIVIWIFMFYLAGCSISPSIMSNTASTGNDEVVIDGQQPLGNATIQLYSVGTAGDKTSAKPLLTKTVTTDVTGHFSITGLYSCTDATEVYITATGGDAVPTSNNNNIALITALGPCDTLNQHLPIVVNELTTIAAVNALAPYMSSYTAIGSSNEDISALDAAFALAMQLVNPATGTSPGLNVPNGYAAPTGEIDTLGNAVATCFESGSGPAGDNSACGTFYSLTSPLGGVPPTNTAAALLNLANNPDLNTASIYQLSSASGPFQPQLSAVPVNFRIALVPMTVFGSAEMSPTNVNFPNTVLGTTSPPQNVALVNNTSSNLTISSISIMGDDSIYFSETNACPAVLATGASCIMQVTFTPQNIISANATLQVNGGLFNVELSGSSNSPPLTAIPGTLQLSPTTINFPATELGNSSQIQDVTLTNNTAASVLISKISIVGGNSVDFVETNQCPESLMPSDSCTIQASFSPQSAVTSNAQLQVNDGEVSASLIGPSSTPQWPITLLNTNPSVYLDFNDSTTNFRDQISKLTFSVGGGSVLPLQPGFDNTQPYNTSAAFSANAWDTAPNNELGSIDWNTPFSMIFQIDQLNWNRGGALVLMSKGNIGTTPGWELVLQMNGTASQLCFYEYGTPGQNQGTCTNGGDAMPNGFNYNIVVTNSGTGANGATGGGAYSGNINAVSLYINGINVGAPVAIYGAGFGSVSFSVSGGSGYADATPVTVTGGGLGCTVMHYEMLATNGIPTRIINSQSGNPNYGCTSIPTVSLSLPTGTGAVITPSLSTPTMNSPYPLMIPGYVSAGVKHGIAGGNITQDSIYVDEAAIIPSVLTPSQIDEMFYQTKFYQSLLGARPTVPPVVIFDDDGCGDLDNTWALEETIALHQLGFINLEGVVQEDNGVGNVAYYRQQLDQAGLTTVPIGIPSNAGSYSGCNTAALNIFDSTTLEQTSYPTASQVYRQVFAANPSKPVSIVIGAPLDGLANFMQSPADDISSLTGMQLFARNAANGGVLYSQGGVCDPSAFPATTPCTGNIGAQVLSGTTYADAAYVYSNGTAMPMIAVGGTPAAAGPGPLDTRTSKDPTYLQMTMHFGTDMRTAWDSLAVSALVTSYFYGGVTVGYSGGSGYENLTLFISTGGGPNCKVTGYMTAIGGVPNGITTLWGAPTPQKDEAGVIAGLGSGCTSVPTLTLVSPTGSDAILTAYATTVCVKTSFPGYSSGQSSGSYSCNNRYQSTLSQWALPNGNPYVYQWFLNSLVDPPSD